MSGDIQDALYNIFTQGNGKELLEVLGSMDAEKMDKVQKIATIVSASPEISKKNVKEVKKIL